MAARSTDFAAGEGHSLGKIVAEGTDTEGDENIEVLLGGKTEFVVP